MPRRRNGIKGLSRALENVPVDAIVELNALVQTIATEEAAAAGMPSVSFGSASSYDLVADISRVEYKSRKTTTTIIYPVKPAGAWSWLENGIDAHRILPKYGRRGSKGRRGALGFGGGHPVRMDGGRLGVQHPGVAAKGTLTKVRERFGEEASEVLAEQAIEVVIGNG